MAKERSPLFGIEPCISMLPRDLSKPVRLRMEKVSAPSYDPRPRLHVSVSGPSGNRTAAGLMDNWQRVLAVAVESYRNERRRKQSGDLSFQVQGIIIAEL